MSKYLGDFTEDSTHYFAWDSNSGDGASITRSTDGEIQIWVEGDQSTATTAGITDDEDEGSVVGVHRCTLVLTDIIYAKAKDYSVVLVGATIDGETVNAVIAEFSIENRFDEVTIADKAQGGTSMVLTFERLVGSSAHADGTIDIDNTAGAALDLRSSVEDGNAVTVWATGAGTAHAIWAKTEGTAYSCGAYIEGVIGIMASGISAAIYAKGETGCGALLQGSSDYPGLICMSNLQVMPNVPHAVVMMPDTNGHGIYSAGLGTGDGIHAVGGDTGHGLSAYGGATSGDGFHGEAQTAGDGMTLVGVGANQYDLNADIHGTIDTVTTATTTTTLTNWEKAGYSLVSTGLDLVTDWTVDITGTVSGNSTHSAANVYTAFGTGGNLTTCATATGFATPANVTSAHATTDAILGSPAGVSMSADVAAVKTDTGNIASRITATLFSGITSLAKWLGALAGKTADAPTLAEIQLTTAGVGYTNTTDSLQAIRDSGGGTVTDITPAALAKFCTEDTGQTVGAAGSVAKISQGTAGGNVTVGDFTVAALAKLATEDTLQTSIASGSVLDLVWSKVIETGINAHQALAIIGAATGGKLSGADGTTVVIAGLGVATTRITATVDGHGNREAVTLTPPS